MDVKPLAIALLSAGAILAAEPNLRVPDGFEIKRVVATGAIHFPMFGALTEDAQLFVTESSGGDLYEELQKLTRHCRISLLRDTNHDGVYDSATVFAENLVPSMGIAWRDGKLYVADPPDLAVLEDTDGDGRADKRTVILSGFGHQDNGSLHGLTFGPDGWLYMTTGQPDGYHFKRADGKIVEGQSGALLRCKPDGSEVEMLSRGFENLVEVAFMPDGEMIGTVNWFYLPQEGVRDALVHLTPGGVYPLNAHTKTEGNLFFSGEVLPPVSVYPAVAQSGLMRYEGSAFPPAMRGNLFSAEHNTRKIVRHQLIRKAATFVSQDEDFISTDNPDFHPSDVLEDADGSLLVIDTGSWYIHHCPTGRIRNTPAEGGIYRVRYKNAGANSKSESPAAQLWNQARKGTLGIDAITAHPAVGLRVASRAGIDDVEDFAIEQLRSNDPPIRLAAAEALGNCGTAKSIDALTEALATAGKDAFIEHALVHALQRVSDDASLQTMLHDERPQIRRAALVILDQPPRSNLAAESAAGALTDPDSNVRAAAIATFRKHGDWMPRAVSSTQALLAKNNLITDEMSSANDLALITLNAPEVRQAIAAGIRDETRPASVRAMLLALAARAPTNKEAWRDSLKAALQSKEESVIKSALDCKRALSISGLEDVVRAIALDSSTPVPLRLEALRPGAKTRADLDAASLEFILICLNLTNAPAIRIAAAEVVSASNVSADQFDRFFRIVRNDSLISPQLVLSVAERAGAAQHPDLLAYQQKTMPPPSADQQQVLSNLEPLLQGGDENRGQQLFIGKAGCAACHRVGKHGAVVGPDLTRVGAIRSGRDLLESLAFPSATFAQGYEPYRVELKSGDVLNGVRVRQPDDSFVLRDAAGNETRIRRDEIKSAERGSVSIMPEGLLNGLSREEIRDILAYLQKLK